MRKLVRTLSSTLLFMMIAFSVFAQNTIEGKIVDDKNQPLPGATIVIKGTNNGTLSDADGNFKLKTEMSGKLTVVINYIGYVAQQIEVDLIGTKELGIITLESDAIGIEEVSVIASIVKDRQTPVSVSNVSSTTIAEKLGNQEFPEILKSTPSVYATKSGGGFGDSRVYLRGFDSNNLGVLINGIPVNDMESGKVYWSNWAGLSEVTATQQVQRGLGASKLALSSVGGTINIITRSTELGSKGSIYYGVGNDGMVKESFTLSTGIQKNGWGATISGGHTWGNGYIQGTNYEGWSYFANISKIINSKQRIFFNIFGAPQWHNQRTNKHSIQDFRDNPLGNKWNSDFGYRNGEIYTTAYAYNYYHKPQASLTHLWSINNTSSLITQVYASIATGGGRRTYGSNANWLNMQFPSGKPYAGVTKLTPEGYIDFNYALEANKLAANGSTVIIANGINNHDWYGLLSTYTKDFDNLKLTAGIDSRYYKGYHAYQIDDLLGGKYYLDNKNINRPNSTQLFKGDYINYHYLGEVFWAGGYTQAEYKTTNYSGFLSASVASNSYRRIDFFQYTSDNNTTPWKSFLPWNVKGGFSYSINDNHSVYINAGYIKRSPAFANTFLNNKNDINGEVKYETIETAEIGYLFSNNSWDIKLDGYDTRWLDKNLQKALGNQTANIPGINAHHQGVELEGRYHTQDNRLSVKFMGSYGNWTWMQDVNFTVYDVDQTTIIGTYNAYIKGVHVGNSAQATAALGIDYEILPKFKLGVDANYYGKNYADFDPTARTTTASSGVDSWKLPDAYLFDMNVSYKFKIGKLDASLYGNVYNILNTEYIADATDGANHDALTSYVWYGFGRTWSTGLRVNF